MARIIIPHFSIPQREIKQVTYLFGAGASYGTEGRPCLPVVSEMAKRLVTFEKDLSKTARVYRENSNEFYERSFEDVIKGVSWLINAANNHSSIDTFAKKLFLKGDDESLSKLKCFLTLFFIYQQLKEKSEDLRYDSFFASILGRSFSLPESIKIVSWNYDHQFEKSIQGFTDSNFHDSQNRLGVTTPFNSLTSGKFSIYKINGSATFHTQKHDNPEIDPFATSDRFNHILDLYEQFKNKKIFPSISFAWENQEPSTNGRRNVLNLVTSQVQKTDVLVIIGYSMPFFNREIDRELILAMKSLDSGKVYIQDTNPEGVKERFLTIKPNFPHSNIVEKKVVDQFLLPGELTL